MSMERVTTLDDVRNLSRVEDEAEVIIIGTGAAGATAARVLSEAGVDVLMVEEGRWVPKEELRLDMYSSMKNLWRDMGFQATESRAVTAVLQGCTVGGSTAVNSAIIHRIPKKIHDEWRDTYGATDYLAWNELERIWDRLEKELHIAPTPEEVVGRNGAILREAAEKLGLEYNVIRRNVLECQASARCSQGCPTARRQSMNNSYVPRSLAQGARLFTHCRVDRVTTRGNRVDGVVGRFRDPRTGRQGPKVALRARRAVIVAASAIQTPMILQASGVGRESKLVGKRLQFHPGIALSGMFDDPVHCYFGATQSMETLHFWEDRYKIETIALPPELASMRFPGVGSALMKQLGEYDRMAIWGVQVRAKAHGSVKRGLYRGRAIIRYMMEPEDVRLFKTSLVSMAEMMFAAGANKVTPGVHGMPDFVYDMDTMRKIHDLPDDHGLFHPIGSHIFGTAIMGPEPKKSVVNLRGETHEVKGLYVADSSVFPTNMGVNPQHAICGVAWRIAEGIANDEKPAVASA